MTVREKYRPQYRRQSTRLRPLLLLPLLLFSTGCSHLTELLVFNKSKHTVAVRFAFEPRSRSEEVKPLAYKIERWSGNKPELGDTVHVYSRMEGDSVWYTELPVNTALVIAQELNTNLEDERTCKDFLRGVRKLDVLSPDDASFSCADTLCYSHLTTLGKWRAGFTIE